MRLYLLMCFVLFAATCVCLFLTSFGHVSLYMRMDPTESDDMWWRRDYTPPSLTSTFLLQCCLSFPSCAPLPPPRCTRMRLTGDRVGDIATCVFAVDGGSGLLSHDSGCVYNDHAWVNCAQAVRYNTPVVCPHAPPSVDVFVLFAATYVCVCLSRLVWPRLTVYAN